MRVILEYESCVKFLFNIDKMGEIFNENLSLYDLLLLVP